MQYTLIKVENPSSSTDVCQSRQSTFVFSHSEGTRLIQKYSRYISLPIRAFPTIARTKKPDPRYRARHSSMSRFRACYLLMCETMRCYMTLALPERIYEKSLPGTGDVRQRIAPQTLQAWRFLFSAFQLLGTLPGDEGVNEDELGISKRELNHHGGERGKTKVADSTCMVGRTGENRERHERVECENSSHFPRFAFPQTRTGFHM